MQFDPNQAVIVNLAALIRSHQVLKAIECSLGDRQSKLASVANHVVGDFVLRDAPEVLARHKLPDLSLDACCWVLSNRVVFHVAVE